MNKLDLNPNIQHMSEIKTGSLCMVPLLPYRLLDFDNKNAVAQGPERRVIHSAYIHSP